MNKERVERLVYEKRRSFCALLFWDWSFVSDVEGLTGDLLQREVYGHWIVTNVVTSQIGLWKGNKKDKVRVNVA